MMQPSTVVAPPQRLTKQDLHNHLMVGWSRTIAKLGRGRFLELLGLSGEGLRKQQGGSFPTFPTIMDAFDEDSTVLDDVFTAKGKRLVDLEAACDTDDIGLHMSRLLAWLHEATHPASPGGERIIHSEMLAGEITARELHRALGTFLEQCSQLRRPRQAA